MSDARTRLVLEILALHDRDGGVGAATRSGWKCRDSWCASARSEPAVAARLWTSRNRSTPLSWIMETWQRGSQTVTTAQPTLCAVITDDDVAAVCTAIATICGETADAVLSRVQGSI